MKKSYHTQILKDILVATDSKTGKIYNYSDRFYISNTTDFYFLKQSNGYWDLINSNTKAILGSYPQLANVELRSVDFLSVKQSEGEDFIFLIKTHGHGKYIIFSDYTISPQYADFSVLHDTTSVITTLGNGMKGLVNFNGKTLLHNIYTSIHETYLYYLLIETCKKIGVADLDGKILIPCKYDKIEGTNLGLEKMHCHFHKKNCTFAVKQNKRWGITDSEGNFIIPLEYQPIIDTTAGLALVEDENGKRALFSRSGKILFDFGTITSFEATNYAMDFNFQRPVNQPQIYHFYDKAGIFDVVTGEIIVDAIYSKIAYIGNGSFLLFSTDGIILFSTKNRIPMPLPKDEALIRFIANKV